MRRLRSRPNVFTESSLSNAASVPLRSVASAGKSAGSTLTDLRADCDRRATVRALYDEWEFDRVLDVGCGDGTLTAAIATACGATDVYGLDRSAENVAATQALGIEAYRMDLDEEPLPFADGAFESVHSGEVIDYVDSPEQYLDEIHRVLQPDGLFVLSAPNLTSLHNRLALLFGHRPYPMRSDADCCGGSGTTESVRSHYFSLDELTDLVRTHGFDVRRVVGCCAYHTEDVPLPERIGDAIVSQIPELAYRNVLVCRARATAACEG